MNPSTSHVLRDDRAVDIFDPALAECPARTLPTANVIDLLHVSHAPDVVAAYRAQMLDGHRFPPIAVIPLAGRFVVADGHKRLAAYRALGRPTILVEVWGAGRFLRDQWRQVVGNTRKNARILRLSVSEPRAAFRLLLTTLQHWRRVAMALTTRHRPR
jgi:hypothetical protein